MDVYQAAKEIARTRAVLQALKKADPWTLQAESRLHKQLQAVFGKTAQAVLAELKRRGTIPTSDLEMKALLQVMFDAGEEFADTMFDGALTSAERGRNQTLARLGKPKAPFVTQTVDLIKDHVFEASERTMSRLVGDVMGNLTESFQAGLGIDDAARALETEFEGMKDWELRRVARTEVNTQQNAGAHLTCEELGIGHEQWWTAEDERVRGDPGGEYPDSEADHFSLHGVIVPIGGTFPNGLHYPGDTSGPLSEFINCRCRLVPFIMPAGMMAPPGKAWFTEAELVPAA